MSENKISNNNYQGMIHIPVIDNARMTKESVKEIKKNGYKRVNKSIYITFCNFLNTIDNCYDEKYYTIWNASNLFNDEYKTSQLVVKNLNAEYNLSLDNTHTAKITRLIVAAEFDFSLEETDEMLVMMLELCKLVKYKFMSGFDPYSATLHSFIEHIKFLSHRILTNTVSDSETEDWDETFIKKYHLAYDCAKDIAGFIIKKYDFIMSQSEILFLAVHIQMIVYHTKH